MAAESSFLKNSTQGSITLLDGTGTPVTLVLTYSDGDLSISNLSDKLSEVVPIAVRGRFKSLNRGARQYPEISFSVFVGNIVGSSAVAPGTPLEFVTATGAYSANKATILDGGPITCDVKLTIEGTDFGDAADETITAEDCRLVASFAESMEGYKLSVSGTVYGAIVHGNSTNTPSQAQIA